MTRNPQPQSPESPPAPSALSGELVEALETQGKHGTRAVNLMKAAELILASPLFPAADEAAQACCRGALESLLKLAGEDFPGPKKATERVVEQAKAVAEARRSGAVTEPAEVEELVNAVDALYEQEQDRGGFRVRQINQLVRDQTGREMGAAEQLAARASWSAFYSAASGVLHGSRRGDGAQALFDGVLMAVTQLFLALPERAGRLRELALLDAPGPEDAAEVAMWTDPRAGEYFFRTAISPDWLGLLPVERILPESDHWPALPYVRRLLHSQPHHVCDWLLRHLAAIQQHGVRALVAVTGQTSEAGVTALPLVTKIVRGTEDVDVLLQAAFWAQAVAPEARTRQWVHVVETILASDGFCKQYEWERGQLLLALQHAAYPEGQPRQSEPKVTEGIRYALATALCLQLARPENRWRTTLVNDLSSVTVDGWPYGDMLVPLFRSVLDLARADAQNGVPLEDRWKPVRAKLPAGLVQDRLLAVHLQEAYPADCAEQERERVWWQTAVPLAGQLVQQPAPRADVAEFLRHLLQTCPPADLPRLQRVLQQGMGPAPSRSEVEDWRQAWAQTGERLPDRWQTVRRLSPVMTDLVLEAWRPLLQAIDDLLGAVASRPQPVQIAVSRESLSGLSGEPFAEQARTDGPAVAARTLLGTPLPRGGDDPGFTYGGLIADLIAQDPAMWAADPYSVTEALAEPEPQAYYFQSLHTAFQNRNLDSARLAEVTEAAFAAHPTGDTAPGAERLARAVCNLLHQAFTRGADLHVIEEAAVTWLAAQVQSWTRPRIAAGHHPLKAALFHPGGSALLALIAWGVNRDGLDSQELPQPLTAVLEPVLDGEPDDQALSVIGLCLAELHRRAPRWVHSRAAALYPLDENWRPAHTWLTYGSSDHQLLTLLDRPGLLRVLSAKDAHEPRLRVLGALLDPAEPLGLAGAFLTALAVIDGGAAAISSLLSSLAYTARREATVPGIADRARALWTAALDARLPAEALKGAGAFAYTTTFDDDAWLDLMALTTEQASVLDAAHAIARRAAVHLGVPQAYRIATALLKMPLDPYRTADVQAAAYSLFTASAPDESAERAVLQRALIDCGQVEAAFVE